MFSFQTVFPPVTRDAETDDLKINGVVTPQDGKERKSLRLEVKIMRKENAKLKDDYWRKSTQIEELQKKNEELMKQLAKMNNKEPNDFESSKSPIVKEDEPCAKRQKSEEVKEKIIDNEYEEIIHELQAKVNQLEIESALTGRKLVAYNMELKEKKEELQIAARAKLWMERELFKLRANVLQFQRKASEEAEEKKAENEERQLQLQSLLTVEQMNNPNGFQLGPWHFRSEGDKWIITNNSVEENKEEEKVEKKAE